MQQEDNPYPKYEQNWAINVFSSSDPNSGNRWYLVSISDYLDDLKYENWWMDLQGV